MKASKRKKLEAAGWKVGSAREFLGLSDEEAAFVPANHVWPKWKPANQRSSGRTAASKWGAIWS